MDQAKFLSLCFAPDSAYHHQEDPNEWTRSEYEHMAKCIVRVTKKCPITMVNYLGSGNMKERRVKKTGDTWNTRYGGREDFLEFEVQYEADGPKTKRNTNLEDVIMLLVMESI